MLLLLALLLLTVPVCAQQVQVKRPVRFDESKPLNEKLFLSARDQAPYKDLYRDEPVRGILRMGNAGHEEVEQTEPGTREGLVMLETFDGLGVGMPGADSTIRMRNPSDNTLAVGIDHIVQIVNSRMAVFTKKGRRFQESGKVLYGPEETRAVFRGFGGPCEKYNNGDAVARYDQLANRWLIVMPIFSKSAEGTYAMCYAVSKTPDPFGPYYRYEFMRELFPDYPRPAVWPDGYYVTTSTGDHVIQKHAAVADRNRMLRGEEATEQIFILDGVNFIINADLEGRNLPEPGSPNILMAAGGTQLKQLLSSDSLYFWKFYTDWQNPANTRLDGPDRIKVARYEYLGGGQLTECVPQKGTSQKLDAQGDKLMSRMLYRKIGGRESIVAVHSVATQAGGGGVRWYELRLDRNGNPRLFQQGTYAPGGHYRWMGSPAIDGAGNIGIGYSFGDSTEYPGQRFAARRATDKPGRMPLREAVLVNGEFYQPNNRRWEDYTQTAIDPVDDRTIWYVGDYIKSGAKSYSTRIGSFRILSR